jgi:hypothetical protein
MCFVLCAVLVVLIVLVLYCTVRTMLIGMYPLLFHSLAGD